MTVHDILLTDLFEMDDIPAINEQLDGCTMSSGALEFDKILNCKRVVNALTFGEMWRQFFGTYPCSYAIRAYLQTCADVRVQSVCDFITGCYPFIKQQMVEGRLNNALVLKPSQLIIDKIFFRYGYRCTNFADVMNFYTSKWRLTISSTNDLCREMCDGLGKPIIQAPINIKKMSELLIFHQHAIGHMGIVSVNPCNGLSRNVPWGHLYRSLRDALSSVTSEPSVVHQIMDARAIISRKNFVGMEQLLKVMVLKSEKVLALCSSPCNLPNYPNLHLDSLFYFDPQVLHLIPKLASTSVVTGFPITLSFNRSFTISYATESNPSSADIHVSQLMTKDVVWIPLEAGGGILSHLCHVLWQTILTKPDVPLIIFHQFVLRYYQKNKNDMVHMIPPNKGADNVIVLVDSRRNIMSIMSILITYHNLVQQDWDIIIVCPDDVATRQWYKTYLGENIELNTSFNTPMHGYTLDVYNDLFKSVDFWQFFEHRGYKRALIIQDDGMIIRKGLELKEWFDCDYVGAPWSEHFFGNHELVKITKNRMVGNGGLSLRNLSAMVDICTRHAKDARELHFMGVIQEPEDIFFAKHAVRVPSIVDASDFSTEGMMNKMSLGFHKLWAYHALATICEYFNLILGEDFSFKIQQRTGTQG